MAAAVRLNHSVVKRLINVGVVSVSPGGRLPSVWPVIKQIVIDPEAMLVLPTNVVLIHRFFSIPVITQFVRDSLR